MISSERKIGCGLNESTMTWGTTRRQKSAVQDEHRRCDVKIENIVEEFEIKLTNQI